jgi:imidazolonepropionase
LSSLAIVGAAQLVPLKRGPLRGDGLGSCETHERASVLCDEGRVVALTDQGVAARATFDASGCTVVPGLVDCHTHLPFFGWRADEDAARLSGERYETLHRREGGIYRSARMLAEARDGDVLAFGERLAASMLRHGTTTFETKSGYGLSVPAELRQLRLARAMSERVPQQVVHTCLAAHAVPKESSQGEWIGRAAEELLPRAAAEGLAGACDLYVESIAFALEHAARLAEAASSLGLRMRIHADQLEDGQAGAFAARWAFATADHLNHTSADAVGDLAASDTVAVLLPGATFTLRQAKRPPARSLIDQGAIVALGSDLNPGTSPIHSLPFVIALACRLYGLRPLEALAGATVNAAAALGLEGTGHLEPGARADLVVLDLPSFDEIAYRPDDNPVIAVVCGGEVAWTAPRARDRIRAGDAARKEV